MPPVFDRLQYAKTEGGGQGNFIMRSAAQLTSQILDAPLIHIRFHSYREARELKKVPEER